MAEARPPHTELGRLLEDASEYHQYVATVRLVHYHMSDTRAWANQVVGCLTVLTAAAGSTGILTKVYGNPGFALTLASGILAFSAAVLAGLQSFFKFGVTAEKHRTAGASYNDIKMKLELFLAKYSDAGQDAAANALAELPALQAEITRLDGVGPGFPTHVFRRIKRYGLAGESLWPMWWHLSSRRHIHQTA
jgi:hypothetical protein